MDIASSPINTAANKTIYKFLFETYRLLSQLHLVYDHCGNITYPGTHQEYCQYVTIEKYQYIPIDSFENILSRIITQELASIAGKDLELIALNYPGIRTRVAHVTENIYQVSFITSE